MTLAKYPALDKMTVAHWGAYCVRDKTQGEVLSDNPEDSAPSLIGTGWLSACLDASVRIQKPAIRKGWLEGDHGEKRCDDSYVEVSWSDAIRYAGDEIARVIDMHGNKFIYGGSYGWASAGRFHHSQSQLRRFLNLTGGYVAARDTYSHAAAEVIFPHILGMSNKQVEEGLTSWPLIAEHCELFLAFGGVSGRTAQIASGGTWDHEVENWLQHGADNGMQTICVSPLKSDLNAVQNTEWLSIRPNTDVALILALSYELIQNNWHDQGFLDQYTSGFSQFKAYVIGHSDGVQKTPEWAATICDVSPSVIHDLAKRLSQSRTMVSVAWGPQRADHGEQVVWAALALACLLGQIGQPGVGFGFGYGSTTPPGRPKRFISWPSVPQGKNKVKDFIPVARLSDMLLSPGQPYTYDGETRIYPDIKLVYWCGGNPFHHHQDLNRLEQAWQQPETVIVHDHSWTATAKRADIVLPATMALEREDIFINRRDPNLVAMRQAVDPFGEAKNDFEILRDLSRHMGFEKAFTDGKTESQWQEEIWNNCRITARENGFSLPVFQDFLAEGRATVPQNAQTRVLLDEFVKDPDQKSLKTESGKISLFSDKIAQLKLSDCPGHPCWIEPVEWLGQALDGALHLISNQPATRLHSQLDNGITSRDSKVKDREVCTLHPARAQDLGVSDDDIIKVFNDRGACLAAVSTCDQMRADCIVLPTGAWLDIQDTTQGRMDVHGNPNMLTVDKGASGLTQGNISHTALVWIEKWTGPLPDVKAFQAPSFTKLGS
ncbi:molybdopterin guanine dinucleotide-containing S/N-oxide reductase [Cognatishimia sp. WU-CL00825]|uniref:molybdopterin-dependent oxidoreductase n=1 Tax=Cognatishimia sp. WU-CL00825 TaxID=3127658 RepID=UPI00310B8AD3